jgi:hypothetical protein
MRVRALMAAATWSLVALVGCGPVGQPSATAPESVKADSVTPDLAVDGSLMDGGTVAAGPTCTALSSLRGDVELKSQSYDFNNRTGTEYLVKDQTANPYFMSAIVYDGGKDVEMVVNDLKTNQSGSCSGGYGAKGTASCTLLVRAPTAPGVPRDPNGDDILLIVCQK